MLRYPLHPEAGDKPTPGAAGAARLDALGISPLFNVPVCHRECPGCAPVSGLR